MANGTPPPPQPTPAKAPTVDEALDEHSALIYSPKAPLAGKFSPKGSTPPPDPDQVRKDDRAVWAFVPDKFDPAKPELLIYFHGHNYFVTARRNGSTVEARRPDWITTNDNNDQTRAATKGAAQGPAGTFYKLDQLDPALAHHPLALAPEDGHRTHDLKGVFEKDASGKTVLGTDGKPIPVLQKGPDGNVIVGPDGKPKQVMEWDGFWVKESDVGTLSAASGLGDLITNVFARLFVLPVVPLNGKNYLTKQIVANDVKRFFLTGHSGGGVPLDKATVSDLALKIPTTLVYLDATYGKYSPEVRKFCETVKLGNGKDESSVVIIFNKDSGTADQAKAIVDELKEPKMTDPRNPKRLIPDPTKKVFAVTELNHTGAADVPAVESALRSNPIVVIKTTTAHDSIPQTFIPIVVKNTPSV